MPSNKARLNVASYVRGEVKRVNTLAYEIRMVLRCYLATTQEFHCWAETLGTRIHLEYDTALKLCRLYSEWVNTDDEGRIFHGHFYTGFGDGQKNDADVQYFEQKGGVRPIQMRRSI